MRYNTEDNYDLLGEEIRSFGEIDNFDEDPCSYGGHEFDEDGICIECGRFRVEDEEMLPELDRLSVYEDETPLGQLYGDGFETDF